MIPLSLVIDSTQSALIKLSNDISVGMDRKGVTMLLLFDFREAFDTACHVTLLRQVFHVQL